MGWSWNNKRIAAQAHVSKCRGKSATYTQPLLSAASTVAHQEDVKSFLAQWYRSEIFEKAGNGEMQAVLARYPDTVGTHYALLVPDTVSFDAFWARYYYRCSVTTVLAEWKQREEDAAAAAAQSAKLTEGVRNKFLVLEIQRGLGSSSSSSPPSSRNHPNSANNSNTINSSEATTSQLSLVEQKMVARAQLFSAEQDCDIRETITEETTEEEYDEEDNATAIGFAAAG